jgi:3-dehydro-4-phosphotetronate decarboxylase
VTFLLSEETKVRDEIASIGKSLFDRGLTFGSTGNISARLSNGNLILTPTNVALDNLEPSELSCTDPNGIHLSGSKPTKEAYLHGCMYCRNKNFAAVVHLHSTFSVALSILDEVNQSDALPPLTAYYAMRVGSLPMVPYYPPGDPALARAVAALAGNAHAVLLANHGPVVAGKTLRDAQYAIEELEETAKLYMLLRGIAIRPLTSEQANSLRPKE